MCTVSMIGDHYNDKWRPQPWYQSQPAIGGLFQPSAISRAEFDDLKRDVLEMKELLKRAKKYDEENGEPDCEMDEKMDLLRKVAKLVGVDLAEVLQKPQS